MRTTPIARQAGAFAVEMGIVFMLFLAIVFAVLEVSRALYMWNTLQEVTRSAARAAAAADFSDPAALAQIKRAAIFRTASGALVLADPITDAHIVIDYLALENQAGGMTQVPISSAALTCPTRNRLVCAANSGDPSCVRFVRVRICQPGSNCTPVPYESMFPIVDLGLTVPISTSIVRAESLGYTPGMAICN
ncbi:MAG: TadE family protein [Pseudomonadota bacterium]